MDDKTKKYVKSVIRVLTQQRNDALNLNTKLQAELVLANAELADTKKKDEEEKKEKADKKAN